MHDCCVCVWCVCLKLPAVHRERGDKREKEGHFLLPPLSKFIPILLLCSISFSLKSPPPPSLWMSKYPLHRTLISCNKYLVVGFGWWALRSFMEESIGDFTVNCTVHRDKIQSNHALRGLEGVYISKGWVIPLGIGLFRLSPLPKLIIPFYVLYTLYELEYCRATNTG